MPDPTPSGRRSRRTGSHRSLFTSRRARREAARSTENEVSPDVTVARATEAEPTRQINKSGGDQRGRLLDALVKPAKGQLVIALVLCVVAFGVVTQIRTQRSDDDYSTARREDLVQLLDGLNQETRRLEAELTDLQQTRENLETGVDADRVAREEAERRAEVLGILAGTKPAQGPGIRLVITDPQGKVSPGILLDAIEEMRDAGAEVIEINDSIRLVAGSWVANGQEGLLIDDQLVSGPISIEVIGDSHSLSEAARFRGGMISEITAPSVGGQVDLTEQELIIVDSLHTPKPNQYAQPAPEEPG